MHNNVAQLRIYVNAHKFQYNLLQIILRERLEQWFLWLNFCLRFNYTKPYTFFRYHSIWIEDILFNK